MRLFLAFSALASSYLYQYGVCAFAPSAGHSHSVRRMSPLKMAIGLGPGEDEPAVLDATQDGTDDDKIAYEVPNHEEYRTSRLTKLDKKVDTWFESLMQGDDEGMILGRVSQNHHAALTTLPELTNDPEKDYDDEEWTPYVATKLPWTPLVPAYGLEQFGLPMPRRGAEAWKQFDVPGMVDTDYSSSPLHNDVDLEVDEATANKYKEVLASKGAWLEDEDVTARLVYVNGRFCPTLSTTTDTIRNLGANDFASGNLRDEIYDCLERLPDGFTDELASPVLSSGEVPLTSLKKLSGPDHCTGEATSQFAINTSQGTACFAALNSLQTRAVTLVDVPAGTDAYTANADDDEEDAPLLKPVFLVHAVTPNGGADPSKEGGVACHPRTLVIGGEASRVSLVQMCIDLEEDVDTKPKLYNGYTQIYVREKANVKHSYLEETGGIPTSRVEYSDDEFELAPGEERPRDIEAKRPALKDLHLETVDVQITGADGAYHGTLLSLGGSGRVRMALSTSLLTENAHATVNGFSLAGGAQRTDMRTNIHHIAQGATSRQAQKTMVGGRAFSTFRGRIRVEQSAQQTDSEQLARTILLSDKAKMWATPSLEIIADDVKCTHGATVSDLSEEELFYLRSRGLDRTTARNMLMYAFVEEVNACIDPIVMGGYNDPAGIRQRTIRRLQNLVPLGDRAIKGEFQSS